MKHNLKEHSNTFRTHVPRAPLSFKSYIHLMRDEIIYNFSLTSALNIDGTVSDKSFCFRAPIPSNKWSPLSSKALYGEYKAFERPPGSEK